MGDGKIESSVAEINVIIVSQNRPPATTSAEFTVDEGALYNGQLTALDPENDSLTYYIVSEPEYGSINLVDNTGFFSYIHGGEEVFNDSFSFGVSDGINNSNVSTVSVTVVPKNDAPTFVTVPNQSAPIGQVELLNFNILGNPHDAEDDAFEWSVFLINGNVDGDTPWNGNITETPAGSGIYSFDPLNHLPHFL